MNVPLWERSGGFRLAVWVRAVAALLGSGHLTPRSVDVGAASGSERQSLRQSLVPRVRYSAGGHAFGPELPSAMPPFANLGDAALRSRGIGTHGEPETEALDTQNDSKAHRVSLRFKDNQAELSSDGKEGLDDYVAEYDLFRFNCHLSQNQKLRFFHNSLRSDAKRCYLIEVDPTVKSYSKAVARFRAEYQSAVNQNQA